MSGRLRAELFEGRERALMTYLRQMSFMILNHYSLAGAPVMTDTLFLPFQIGGKWRQYFCGVAIHLIRFDAAEMWQCDSFSCNLVLVMVIAMPSPKAHDGKWTGTILDAIFVSAGWGYSVLPSTFSPAILLFDLHGTWRHRQIDVHFVKGTFTSLSFARLFNKQKITVSPL